MALRSSDYSHGCIDSLLAQPKNLAIPPADSLQLILKIKQIALHFFEDLSYGNKAPSLDFIGVKNPVKDAKLVAQVEAAWAGNSLASLANLLYTRVPEVNSLIEALAHWNEAERWKNRIYWTRFRNIVGFMLSKKSTSRDCQYSPSGT